MNILNLYFHVYNGIQLNNVDGPIYYPYYFPLVTPHIYTLHAGRITILRRGLRSVSTQNTTGKKPHFARTKSKVNEKRNSII